MLCKILPEQCIACGLCQVYAPDLFDYTDDGLVCLAHAPATQTECVISESEAVLQAYRKCPVHAIHLEK